MTGKRGSPPGVRPGRGKARNVMCLVYESQETAGNDPC